jgi:hypothetical protein
MDTRVDEIASGVYRISTYIPEADFMFNQFLVDGEEPLLFHTGPPPPVPARLPGARPGAAHRGPAVDHLR